MKQIILDKIEKDYPNYKTIPNLELFCNSLDKSDEIDKFGFLENENNSAVKIGIHKKNDIVLNLEFNIFGNCIVEQTYNDKENKCSKYMEFSDLNKNNIPICTFIKEKTISADKRFKIDSAYYLGKYKKHDKWLIEKRNNDFKEYYMVCAKEYPNKNHMPDLNLEISKTICLKISEEKYQQEIKKQNIKQKCLGSKYK